ncbi:kinase-like domain-containing protein [Trametes meyenii]|nr:kinase-like domain-containing protein [Trametes meyenii]
MSNTMSTTLTPRFPLLQRPQLPCPSIGCPSSAFSKKIFFYIHEKLLKPLSVYYCRFWGVTTTDPATGYILPFGLILKCSHRATEQEGLAMNLARAMGVPAPRFISFGQPPPGSLAPPSILMTRLRGTELDQLDDDKVDLDVIRGDLINILATMRRFTSPHGDAVCGVDGGPVRGPLIPISPCPACANEAAFYDTMRRIGYFSPASDDERGLDDVAKAEEFFALAPHAIVFTHGDLHKHNIMVGADGHISGIIDWESAAWLPEYWEFGMVAIFAENPWGQFMANSVAAGAYADEIVGQRYMYNLVADSLSY